MMSLLQAQWRWIAGGVVAVLLLAWALRPKRRSHRPAPPPSWSAGEAAAQQAADRARADAQRAMDQQRALADQVRAISQRVAAVEEKLAEVPRTEPRAAEPAPARGYGDGGRDGFLETIDSTLYGAASLASAAGGERSWQPGPGDQPVEIREGVLVVSRSLPPAAYVASLGGGHGRVFLNPDVQMTEFSLPKWAAFFDLQGARPYAAYRTTRPAEVRWDEGQGRGELISKGLAEAI